MFRKTSAIVFTLFLTLGFFASALHQKALAITTSEYCMDGEEQAFLQLINTYRAQNGKGQLVALQTLGAAADHHSIDMATYNYFSHSLAGSDHNIATTADNISWSQNMNDHGYTYTTYRGENVDAGRQTAQLTFTAWKNSPGHNANMLNSNYRGIGIGRAYGPNSTYKWYWTTDFGGIIVYAGVSLEQGRPCPTTPTPTNSPTPTPTRTPTPTYTPTPTNTPFPTPTSPFPSVELTATPTLTPTRTPTPTFTPTPTPTLTPSPTVTIVPTLPPSPTPGVTDTIPPKVSMVAPSNGSSVANGSRVLLYATASDNVAVKKVDFYVNATLYCSDTSPSYYCYWTAPTVIGQTVTLEARAYDTSGNSASSTIQVTTR